MKRDRFKDIGFILLLILLVFLFFSDLGFIKSYCGERELVDLDHPAESLLAYFVNESFTPLWFPEFFGILPLFTKGVVDIVYPVNIFLYYFLMPYKAFFYSLIIHFILGGFFIYLYLRLIDLDSFSSFIGSLTFVFGGYLVNHLCEPYVIKSLIWLPAIVFFLELSIRKSRVLITALSGLCWGLLLLTGNIQIGFYSIIFIFLYYLVRIWGHLEIKKIIFNLVVFFFSVFILGLLIFSIQIFANYEIFKLAKETFGFSFGQISLQYFTPHNLVSLLIPIGLTISPAGDYWGMPHFWEDGLYIGLVPLVLVIAAVCLRRDRFVNFYAAAGICSIIIALGSFTPFYRFWLEINIVSKFKEHTEVLYLFSFSTAVLAGIGANNIFNLSSNKLRNFSLGLVITSLLILPIFYIVSRNPIGGMVAGREYVFQALILFLAVISIMSLSFFKIKGMLAKSVLVGVVVFDLFLAGGLTKGVFHQLRQMNTRMFEQSLMRVFEGEALGHRTGRGVGDTEAINGTAVCFCKGVDIAYEPLTCGPYLDVPRGYYKINYCIKFDEAQPDSTLAELKVVNHLHQKTLFSKKLEYTDVKAFNQYGEYSFGFYNDKEVTKLEFITIPTGKSNIWIDRITLVPDLTETMKKNNEEILLCLGSNFMERGFFQKALEEFRLAAVVNQASIAAHFGMGFCYRHLGNDKEAIGEFRKVLELSPDHLEARKNLQLLYEEANEDKL